MSKIENIKKQIEDAERKILTIQENSAALRKKKENIEKQLVENEKKIRQINFFLVKTKKTLQSKNS